MPGVELLVPGQAFQLHDRQRAQYPVCCIVELGVHRACDVVERQAQTLDGAGGLKQLPCPVEALLILVRAGENTEHRDRAAYSGHC